MREDFERKLTKNEFDNLMVDLNRWFKPESIPKIFEYFMENGSYTWTQGKFTNKIGLLYKTNADIILHKATVNSNELELLSDMINNEQSTEKEYFLFINYHKAPQMWRLEDRGCIWGVGVHESYKPLQGEYFRRLNFIREEERIKKEKEKQNNLNVFYSKYVNTTCDYCDKEVDKLYYSDVIKKNICKHCEDIINSTEANLNNSRSINWSNLERRVNI